MAGRNTSLVGSIAAARLTGISLRQLYYWVQVRRIVQPRAQRHGKRLFVRFTDEDLDTLKAVKRFVDQGYTLRAAVHKVSGRERGSPPGA